RVEMIAILREARRVRLERLLQFGGPERGDLRNRPGLAFEPREPDRLYVSRLQRIGLGSVPRTRLWGLDHPLDGRVRLRQVLIGVRLYFCEALIERVHALILRP